MRVLMVFPLLALLLASLCSLSLAGEPPVPIEGLLLVESSGGCYFMEGSSDNTTPASDAEDVSPHADALAGTLYYGIGPEPWHQRHCIGRGPIDGSPEVNLTIGLGGINCVPSWSPDGSQIAFMHCDPVEGEWPCETGFHVWVMNANSTGAHRVTPEGSPRSWIGSWSPNSYRLLLETYDPATWETEVITIDTDGTDLQVLPNILYGDAHWSPDGAKIVTTWTEPDTVGGEPGVWRQLRVTNADGSNPQTLVQQFISDSDVNLHLAHIGGGSMSDVRDSVGPRSPRWSPNGDRIAFLQAMPFEPLGPEFRSQIEVWVYDLVGSDLTKITTNLDVEWGLSWVGPNTLPTDPQVTISNATVTFSAVTEEGLTTIIRDDDPIEPPIGFQFCGEYYDIKTTAGYSGPVAICLTYNDADVPGGDEGALALLHYNLETDEWEDVTTFKDTDANLVCGQVESVPRPGLLPVPIEGKMLLTVRSRGGEPYGHTDRAYFLEGSSDNLSPAPGYGDISPLGDQVAYVVDSGLFPNHISHVWKADIDGSNPVDLTAFAGLNGINGCNVRWSPDASRIAFDHCDPPGPGEEGLLPCQRGFHVWIMNSDGTDAHRVTPEGASATFMGRWAPNGGQILCERWPGDPPYSTTEILEPVIIDVATGDMEPALSLGIWSPDGSKFVSRSREPGELDGEPGVWCQVRLSNPDGSDLQILFQYFITDSDVTQHLQAIGADPEDPFTLNRFYNWVSLNPTAWSPSGARIALNGGLPFHPHCDYYYQSEIWLYELATGALTKITDNVNKETVLSWIGPNTFPSDPEVTVDNTTVTFSDVTGEGLTTIIRDDDPPTLPADYQFCGEYYNIDTTATYTPPITICMTYEDGDVPGGNEEALCLLHYNETTEEYENITTSRDTEANTVCGQTDSLLIFGLALEPIFGGFRPPINADGTSEWKAGRTIPVKFMITDALGAPITNAICHLSVWGPLPEAAGDGVLETAEAESADVGDTFRYDEDDGQYIYNLSTKGWAPGAYLLEVTVEGWPGFAPSIRIGLR